MSIVLPALPGTPGVTFEVFDQGAGREEWHAVRNGHVVARARVQRPPDGSTPPARTDFIEWRDDAMLYLRKETGIEIRWRGATIWPRC